MKITLLAVLLLNWAAFSSAQLSIGISDSGSPSGATSIGPSSSDSPTTAAPPPTTTNNPPPTSSDNPQPTSSDNGQQPSSSNNVQPSSSNYAQPSKSKHSQSYGATDSSTASSGPSASESSSSNNNNNSGGGSEPNTGAIAGGVVGGVVGLALIGGLVTWLNRRGGCTSRTQRRHVDTFDDFAAGGDDLEHNNNNNMAGMAAVGGAASPFQRRLVPPTAGNQSGSYMNLEDDYSSETTGMVAQTPGTQYSQPYAYPPAASSGEYYGTDMAWQQQQQQLPPMTDPHEKHLPYDPAYPSPAMSQTMKPDAVDHHKPHEV
ncbi:hypothetical protein BC940DRAFT_322253 [Gongronella butleri]|nr:hypothetical protein BC940DRAFT_322253 [Gongronella butleri]